MRMTSDWPSEDVPEGDARVAGTASAVTDTCVSVSAFGVIVEAEVIDCMFGSILVALMVAADSVPVNVGLADNTVEPVPVDVVTPVPPLPTASVPATVTAPCVAVDGVRPVDPKLIDVTALDVSADQDGAAPVLPTST
jgi:hypothetical protein